MDCAVRVLRPAAPQAFIGQPDLPTRPELEKTTALTYAGEVCQHRGCNNHSMSKLLFTLQMCSLDRCSSNVLPLHMQFTLATRLM